MDDMGWLTFGLLVFAAVQAWVTHRAEVAQREQREAEEKAREAERERTLDAALQVAHAESFRMWTLTKNWREQDLVVMSAVGLLAPDRVLPTDGAKILDALAMQSYEAGYLGVLAHSLAHGTARNIAMLNSVVDEFRHVGTGLHLATNVRSNRPAVAGLEAKIKENLAELSALLEDAMKQSTRAGVLRDLNFSGDLQSKTGRSLAEHLNGRPFTSASPPNLEQQSGG
jgi:hypothetical protein